MKNFNAWLVILPMLTIACSDDYQNENIQTNTFKLKNSIADTGKAVNPYENAGLFQNEILDIYEATYPASTTFYEAVNRIDSIASHRQGLQSQPLLQGHVNQIGLILSQGNNALLQVVSSSTLGATARQSFQSLVNSVKTSGSSISDQDAVSIIEDYEDTIMKDGHYTSEELRILLTTCSLWEYSLKRKRRRDLDWDTSMGHIAAMLYGAEQNMDVAVRVSSVGGLCYNEGITP